MKYAGRILGTMALIGLAGCSGTDSLHSVPCEISRTISPMEIEAYVLTRRISRPGANLYSGCDILYLAKKGQVGNYTLICNGKITEVNTIDKAPVLIKRLGERVVSDYKQERLNGCVENTNQEAK